MEQNKAGEIFSRCIDVPLRRPNLKVRQLEVCLRRATDTISKLPDDILIKILSLLPMKESGRTSVLSKRWRDTWSYAPLLHFNPGNQWEESMMLDLNEEIWNYEKLNSVEEKHFDWVDRVVSSHKAPTIDEVRVRFGVERECRNIVDNWIRFACEKKVKRLELNFLSFFDDYKQFPYSVPTTLSSYNLLTSLELVCVNVTGETLERLIYNCQSLELLSVTESYVLEGLKVSGPSLKLKYLTIHDCIKMKNLEISAPNLVCLNYFGRNTPKLAEIFICGIYCEHLLSNYSDFYSCFSKIEVLRLDLPVSLEVMEVLPICPRLKILDITSTAECEKDLFRFSSLIKACPFLHKFVLRLYRPNAKAKIGLDKKEACPHEHLKVVEIVGFVDSDIELGFVKYLMEIAVSLDKIVIDPRHFLDIEQPENIGTPWEFLETIGSARKAANHELSSNLKPGIDLVIR